MVIGLQWTRSRWEECGGFDLQGLVTDEMKGLREQFRLTLELVMTWLLASDTKMVMTLIGCRHQGGRKAVLRSGE